MTPPTPTQADVDAVAKAIAEEVNRAREGQRAWITHRETAAIALTTAMSLGYRRDRPGLSAEARETIKMALSHWEPYASKGQNREIAAARAELDRLS